MKKLKIFIEARFPKLYKLLCSRGYAQQIAENVHEKQLQERAEFCKRLNLLVSPDVLFCPDEVDVQGGQNYFPGTGYIAGSSIGFLSYAVDPN